MNMNELFIFALTHPGNQEALREVAKNAEKIHALLDEHDPELTDQQNEILDEHPEWVAQIYDALATDHPLDEDEEAAIRELTKARLADEISVGKSFKNGLIRDLTDPELLDWERWFGGLPEIGGPTLAMLIERADVAAARPEIDPLVIYGISPLSLCYSSQAILPVALRWAEIHKQPADGFILSADPSIVERSPEALPPDQVVTSIAAMSACAIPVADRVFAWMTAMSREKSFLFSGFTAQAENEYIRLTRIGGDLTIREQWSHIPPPKQMQPPPSPKATKREIVLQDA
jgi:hypothetical protein